MGVYPSPEAWGTAARARAHADVAGWPEYQAQIPALATERIGQRRGRASTEEMAQLLEGLNEIIGT